MIERRILVTGSSGLLGHAVMMAAARDSPTVGFDAAPPDDPVANTRYVRGDLRDPFRLLETMRDHRITDVVHAGAISHPLLYADQPTLVYAINVSGTLNVLEAARLCSVRRLVFVSSAAVYGSSPADALIDETSPLQPDTIYAATKAAAEMLVHGYARRFDLATVILRPVSLYGLRRRTFALPNYLMARALDGLPSRVRHGDQAIDFVDVQDAARAALLALETSVGLGKTYVVASGVQHTHRAIAELVRALVPGSRIDVEAGWMEGAAEGHYSVSRAERDLGFRTTTSLESGLARLKRDLDMRPDLRRVAGTATELAGSTVG